MIDGSWIRTKVDAVLVPVIKLFLQTQNTLAQQIATLRQDVTTEINTAIPPAPGQLLGGSGTAGLAAPITVSTGLTLSNGVLIANGSGYTLPTATSTTLGAVKPDGTTITNNNGAISVTYGTTANTAAQGNDPRIVGALSTTTAASTYAPLVSAPLTGTPTAPTAAPGTNTTQLATTAYTTFAVAAETTRAMGVENLKAPLVSPPLTGTPTAPTAAPGTNTTQLATTAFTTTAVANEAAARSAAINAVNQSIANLPLRIRLTANRTFYVNATTGSDTTGSGTSAAPWATLPTALWVVENLYDLANFTVTLSCSGNFTVGVGVSGLLVGQNGPTSLVFDGGGTAQVNVTSGSCFNCTGGQFTVQNFGLLTTSGSIAGGAGDTLGANQGTLLHKGNNFGSCVNAHIAVWGSGAVVGAIGDYTISGGAPGGHLSAGALGLIYDLPINSSTVTITGTPTFTNGFANGGQSGVISYVGVTFVGNALGPRYSIGSSATIYTNGRGLNYFPGSAPGYNDGTGAYDAGLTPGGTPVGFYNYSFDEGTPPASPITLQPRDRCTITFSSVTGVPLRITTVQNAVYRAVLIIASDTTINSDLEWRPNDTTYSGAFTEYWTGATDSNLTQLGSGGAGPAVAPMQTGPYFVGTVPLSQVGPGLNSFQLDQFGGPSTPWDTVNDKGASMSEYLISTWTVAKTMKASTGVTGGTSSSFLIWNDTTTPWLSLGTIRDTNGATLWGTVIIERLS